MTDEAREFLLRLSRNGPVARGRLLGDSAGTRRQQFLVLEGSPAQARTVPSFEKYLLSSFRVRERLKADGSLRPSLNSQDLLEFTRDTTFSSPSQAADVLTGSSSNGWAAWKAADGRTLREYVSGASAVRAWFVRSMNVAGLDMFESLWLPEQIVSLSAKLLRAEGAMPGATKDALRAIVEEDYESTASYDERLKLVEDLHDFLSRMNQGDLLATTHAGRLHLGEITGPAVHVRSEDGRSNLRRAVEWQEDGFDIADVPMEIRQKVSGQGRDVVELTKIEKLLRSLGTSPEDRDVLPDQESADAIDTRDLALPDPTDKLADKLLIDRDWLREVKDLLWDDKQIVLYGPPGTGKTYLAQHLAEFLGGGPEQVKLVQFHPSYSYEDFFEGFRPREDTKTGDVAFRLTAGPLRELADLASREENRHVPHFLIIDELNRANLAKVFGELYFLLEYRDKSVRLTYSADDFALPPNLFIIGTMNTADRSIALVDAAMRRRFAFIELSPRTEPTRGLLHRWLRREGKEPEAALLLDALNARIPGEDFKIGPSYLMKPGVYRAGGLERTWRTKILPLLEEHHYGEDVPIEQRYGIAALRRSLGLASPTASTSPAQLPDPPLERSVGLRADGNSGPVSAPLPPALTSQRPLFGSYAATIGDDVETGTDHGSGSEADSRTGRR